MIRSGAWVGAALLGVAALLLVGGIASARRTDVGRIYPGVHASHIDLSNLSKGDATAKLGAATIAMATQPLTARFADGRWSVTPNELGVLFDVPGTVSAAYAVGRDDNPVVRLGTLFSRTVASSNVAVRYRIDDAKLQAFVHKLSSIIDQPVQDAGVGVVDAQVQVRHAKDGRKLDADGAASQIKDRLASLSASPIDLKVEVTPVSLDDTTVADAAAQATRWLRGDVTVQSPIGDVHLTKTQIASAIRFSQPQGDGHVQVSIDQDAIRSALTPLEQKLGK